MGAGPGLSFQPPGRSWKETGMEWREVIEHPSLKNLPFKIETNEWGQIEMTPTSHAHERKVDYSRSSLDTSI